MRFAKYQGVGNDFVLVADVGDRLRFTPEQVRHICDRRFGIGADGVIRVAPGDAETDFFMDYSNSDGSVGMMCGNGIRCMALFARAEGLTDATTMRIGTRSGVKVVELTSEDRARVDMGPPAFGPSEIPVDTDGPDALHLKLDIDGEFHEVTCLSMGNPHAVLLVDEPEAVDIPGLGARIENHPIFPNKANVEFVTVESPQRVRMRVWERGSGETLACGTGACAVAVATRLLRSTDPTVTVASPGGDLLVEWDGSLEEPATVYLTGPADRSFDGDIEL